MSRRAKASILVVVFTLVILGIIVGVKIVEKYTPSDEVMDLKEHYKVDEDESLVIFQDGTYEQRALYEDGENYLEYDEVVELFNKRFYWDTNENLLIYTSPTELIRTEIGSRQYSVNKNTEEFDYPISKTKKGKLYVSIAFVEKYSNIEYEFYKSPNRIVIKNHWDKYLYTKVEKATQLRVDDNIKSEILLELEEGRELKYVDNGTIYSNGFDRVMTDDGVIGFVRGKDSSESYYKALESTFVEPEYVQTQKPGPINLVWHQVTNQEANNNILHDLEGTKGLTTISPTWYSITSNEGTISSLASETYVERVHSLGIEVWALIDDFNPEIDIVEVLSYSSKREKLINELIASSIKYNLDGLNIDFETVPLEGGIHFVQFLRELSIKCRSNGIVLSVDNYVPREYTAYYNLEEQGIVVDYVIIMAYDEHHSGSDVSGSVSSIGFVEDAIERTLTMLPKERAIIGIPFYSRLWREDASGVVVGSQALAMSNAEVTLRANGVEPNWNSDVGQYYGEYEKEGLTYRMWQENEESIDLKMKAIDKADVAGVAQWKLGLEKDEIWNIINKYLN